jgi:dihydroflavonol-4-reductase
VVETVLVTGATGYVAGWCIVELLNRGFAVRATVRSLAKEPVVRATIAGAVDADDRLSFVAADLSADLGWDTAVAGCDYVLHVASPLGVDNPKNPDALIVPARDGALRVLRAAADAGVKRVVMTSSCAAASPPLGSLDSITDETLWTDPDEKGLTAYRKSKVLSERAAWDFMREHPGTTELTTILPGAVFGPVLTTQNLGSVQVIGRVLQGRPPGTPRLGMNIVDVRDVADAHVRAMTSPEAAGERFIAVNEFLWMSEIAQILRSTLGARGSKVPTRTLPDFVLRFLARFDPTLRSLTPMLGRRRRHSSAKARRLLGWSPRPAATTVVDCAESLIAQNAI